VSSPAIKNISVYKNSDFRHNSPVSRPHEGRFAIVTDRWAGMRWAQPASGGGFRWTRTRAAYGKVVWSWRRDRGVKLRGDSPRGDGGKKRRFTGESTKDTVQTIARGKPGLFRLNLW